MSKKRYRLPEGVYDPTFLKALACAIHMNKLEPAELEFWYEDGRDMVWMAKEMYNRVSKTNKTRRRPNDEYERDERQEF